MKHRRPMAFIEPGGEFRAGRLDAQRTPNPRPFDGFKWGDVFYGLGYFVGAVIG